MQYHFPFKDCPSCIPTQVKWNQNQHLSQKTLSSENLVGFSGSSFLHTPQRYISAIFGLLDTGTIAAFPLLSLHKLFSLLTELFESKFDFSSCLFFNLAFEDKQTEEVAESCETVFFTFNIVGSSSSCFSMLLVKISGTKQCI